jgi:hypothetical protein
MPADPELDKAFAALAKDLTTFLNEPIQAALHTAFMAGISIGQERNRSAAAEAIKAFASATGISIGTPETASPVMPTAKPRGRANGGYSGVVGSVRQTLHEIGRSPEGIDAVALHKHISTRLGRPDISVRQIRSALKQLSTNGEAVRFERGCYRAGTKLVVTALNGGGDQSLFKGAA